MRRQQQLAQALAKQAQKQRSVRSQIVYTYLLDQAFVRQEYTSQRRLAPTVPDELFGIVTDPYNILSCIVF